MEARVQDAPGSSGWPDIVGYADLPHLGVSRYMLDKAVTSGEYERITPGVFYRTGSVDDTTATWAAIASKRPRATLCLLTAASLHDLTDEVPRHSHIGLPRGTHPVTTTRAPVVWHHFNAPTFSIGRDQHMLPGGTVVGISSPERTVIDFFRARHRWGSDLATAILKQWLSRRGNSPAALLTMAKQFPDAYPSLLSTLEVLL